MNRVAKRSRSSVTGDVISKELVRLRRKFHYSEDVIARLSFFYSIFRAEKIIENLRKPPEFMAVRVNSLKADPKRVLEDLRATGINVRFSNIFPDVLLIKIEGPFDLPKAEKRIIAKDKSAEGVMLGANLYAPGVLEVDTSVEIGDDVIITTKFGEVVAYGTAKISAKEKARKGVVVEVKKSKYKIPNVKILRPFINGEAYLSTLASTQMLKWFAPTPDDKILCISPNAEDLVYLLQLTDGEADITVISKTDLEDVRIREGLRKMKMEFYEKRIKWHVIDYRYLNFDPESYDMAFISPRSSRIGLRPRLSAFLKEEDIIALSRDARRLLDRVVPAIRKGGRLLFTVISLDPAEGELIVRYLINNWKLKPVNKDYKWGAPGFKEIEGGEKTFRIYPDIHDDIGFFGALLEC